MKIQIIIFAIIFIYLAFSTLFYGTGLAGNIGDIIGGTNIELFGNLAYINIFLLFYPIYKIQQQPSKLTDIDFYTGWLLFFISLVILSSLIFESSESGSLAMGIDSFFLPYIGKIGIWLLWVMIVLLYLVLTVDDDFDVDDFNHKLYYIKEFLYYLIDKINNIKIPQQIYAINFSKIIRNPFENFHNDIMMPYNPNTKIDINSELKDKVIIINEIEDNSKLLDEIEKGEQYKPKNFKLPKTSFLEKVINTTTNINAVEIDIKIKDFLEKLKTIEINGDVLKIYLGPIITIFEFKPAPNLKVSKILNLKDELIRVFGVKTIRIETSITDSDIIKIEIPNDIPDTIYLREILESKLFKESKSPLTIALGKDIVGNPFITDLRKVPNILIVGDRVSEKSIGINAIILSLLYQNDPDNLRLVLIDSEILEFSIYHDIPHLLTPIIIDVNKAILVLANLVLEMDRRYKVIADNKVKKFDDFNEKMEKEYGERMPFIVIFIDELADLMMTGGKEVEYSIIRLAKMARDVGIYLVVATQKPNIDITKNIIQTNLPSRLSYKMKEEGDALFNFHSSAGLIRLHAPWNTDIEVKKIVEFLKAQRVPNYDDNYLIIASN